MYRIVICIDVEAADPEAAYQAVYDNMATVDTPNFSWESTDEWFGPDGEELDQDTITKVRMAVLNAEST